MDGQRGDRQRQHPAGRVDLHAGINFNGNFTIATSVSDGVAAAITGSKAVTGIAVNDPPTATNLSTAETYTEDTPLNLIDIVVSDVDSPDVTASLTLSNPAAGSLSTATSGAVTSTYNAATGVWSGTARGDRQRQHPAGRVDLHAGRIDFNGNFTIATSVSDGVAAAITGSKAVTGIAVNNQPTGHEPRHRRDVHRGHAAEPDRHRGQRRGQPRQ